MDQHTILEVTDLEEDAQKSSAPLSAPFWEPKFRLEVQFSTINNPNLSFGVTCTWDKLMEMLNNGPAYWDTVAVDRLVITKVDA